MSKFSTTMHLAPEVAEDEIDKIGKAILIEQARQRGMAITGDVERIYDEFVVGVQASTEGGTLAITHVPITSPLAEGRTEPEARMVSWQADAEPITGDPAVEVVGESFEGKFARAWLPEGITQGGGMINFRHNLGSRDVTVSAYDAQGGKVGYAYAVEISENEQQVLLVPGARQIQAVVDVEEAGE